MYSQYFSKCVLNWLMELWPQWQVSVDSSILKRLWLKKYFLTFSFERLICSFKWCYLRLQEETALVKIFYIQHLLCRSRVWMFRYDLPWFVFFSRVVRQHIKSFQLFLGGYFNSNVHFSSTFLLYCFQNHDIFLQIWWPSLNIGEVWHETENHFYLAS